jgi:hypothetical protein
MESRMNEGPVIVKQDTGRVRDTPDLLESYSNAVVDCVWDGSAVAVVLAQVRRPVERIGKETKITDAEVVINARPCLSEKATRDLHRMLGQVLAAIDKNRSGHYFSTPQPPRN